MSDHEPFVPIARNELNIEELIAKGETVKHLKKDRQMQTEASIKRMREYYKDIESIVDKHIDPDLLKTTEDKSYAIEAIRRRRTLSTLISNATGKESEFHKRFFPKGVEMKCLVDCLNLSVERQNISPPSFPNMDEATKFPWCHVAVHYIALGWSYENTYLFLWYGGLIEPTMNFTLFCTRIKLLRGWIRLETLNLQLEYKHIMEMSRKEKLDRAMQKEATTVKVLEREIKKVEESLEKLDPVANRVQYATCVDMLEKLDNRYFEITGKAARERILEKVQEKVIMHATDEKLAIRNQEQSTLSNKSQPVDSSFLDVDVSILNDIESDARGMDAQPVLTDESEDIQ